MNVEGSDTRSVTGEAGAGPGAFPGWPLAMAVSVGPSSFQAVSRAADLPVLFRELRALGFSGVELAVRDPAGLDSGRLSTLVKQAGLEIVALATGQMFVDDGLSLSDPDPGVREAAIERLRGHLDLAASLGCPSVIIGLARGRTRPGHSRPDALKRVRDGLEALAAHAQARSLRLLVEPINRYETDLLNTLDEAWELCRDVPCTALLADTFHMNIEEPVIEASLVRHAAHLGHVHLADSNRLAPGLGHVDFRSILSVLAAVGYSGWLSAEVVPEPDARTAAARTAAFVAALSVKRPAAAAGREGGVP